MKRYTIIAVTLSGYAIFFHALNGWPPAGFVAISLAYWSGIFIERAKSEGK